MKAAYTKVPFNVEIRDVQKPRPLYGEVLIKIRACGVCGTDVHYASKVYKEFGPMGHEISGEVVECGEGISKERWKPGAKVVVGSRFCGICRFCQKGMVENCKNPGEGNPDSHGGYCEYLCCQQNTLIEFSRLDFIQASLAEPLSVAIDLVELGDLKLGDNVLIVGPGPIGLMAVKIAKLKGARNVILAGHSQNDQARLKAGLKLGADSIIEIDKENMLETLKSKYPSGVERVLVTAPPKCLPQAMEAAQYGGIIAYLGIAFDETGTIAFDADKFHFKKLQLRASFASPPLKMPIAVDLLERRVIDPDLIITHVFVLDKLAEALKVVAGITGKRNEVIKAVVEI